MPPAVQYVASSGVSIAWSELGQGPIDVAFVPGFISHQELLWEEPRVAAFFERLASFSRLILWDKREQGLSDRVGRPPTLEESMNDLLAVLDAAGSERAMLFGISEGGPMELLFAATYPERVDRLAVYGSWARLMRAPDYPQGIPDAVLEHLGARLMAEWGGPAVLDEFSPSSVSDPALSDWWARVLRSGASPHSAASLLALYREIDVRGILGSITRPTLVLHRRDDRMVRAAHGRYLAEHIPGARYVELEGDDHLAFTGDTAAILDEVQLFATGRRPERAPERVLATVLFEDIVESTQRAVALGDARWRELLAAHDRAVEAEVQRAQGRVVKHLGDGTLAIFDGPARAVRAALAIREATAALGLDIRVGVHTGELERIGDDVGGIAVHIGARVAAAAASGEVLVSRTVTDLVAGSGLTFEGRGEHELKGVPGRWALAAAVQDADGALRARV
jgi:class 3 adenylate cyclase